jgi:hypothetical protein
MFIGECFEAHGAHKGFWRFDEQDGGGEAAVVEAAAEMGAGLDGEDVEPGGVEAHGGEGFGRQDLGEEGADDEHVAVAEADMEPRLAGGAVFAGAGADDGAGDADGLAGRDVGEAADFHVEGVAGAGLGVEQVLDHGGVGDGADQGAGQVLVDDFA